LGTIRGIGHLCEAVLPERCPHDSTGEVRGVHAAVAEEANPRAF